MSSPDPLMSAAQVAQARAERFAPLWQMTRAQRIAAYWRGELSIAECLAWARRFPHEPPRAVDGEWHFIATKTPEYLGE